MEEDVVVRCELCGHMVPVDESGSFMFHSSRGVKCRGSYQPVDTDLFLGWLGEQKKAKDALVAAVKELKSKAEAVNREPWELCKGGPKPRTGCVACGDRMYMAATQRPDLKLPHTFDAWRNEYEITGIPWAKERMESFVTLQHASILDADWKPRPVIGTTPILPPAPRVFTPAGVALATVAVIFVILGSVFGGLCQMLFVPAFITLYIVLVKSVGNAAIRRTRGS